MPKRTAKQLTDRGIKKLAKAAPGRRRSLPDAVAPGLVLRVTDKGSKTWNVHYRLNGKQARMTLGRWPDLDLADAREQARAVRRHAKEGIDPKLARKIEAAEKRIQIEAKATAGRTFGDLAGAYIRRHAPTVVNSERHTAVVRRRLIPALGHLLISELKGHHLVELTDQIMAEGSPAAACRVHSIAKHIFTWALGRSERGVDHNPFAHLKPPAKKTARQRILRDHEIRALWLSLTELDYPYAHWGKLLILLGQRRGETAMMQHKLAELDVEAGVWTIPAAKAKSDRDHLVPLPDMAVAILRDCPIGARGNFVFSVNGGERPVTAFSVAKARLDTAMRRVLAENGGGDLEPWVWHDLRRTCRSGLAALGVPEIVAERVIGHGPKGIAAVYNLHEYEQEKAEALERWAGRIRDLTTPPPDNVSKLEIG